MNREHTMTLRFLHGTISHTGKADRIQHLEKKVNSFIFFFYRHLHTQYHCLTKTNSSLCFPKREAWPSQSNNRNISLHIHYYIKLYKIFFFFFLLMTTEKEFWYSPIPKLGSDLITSQFTVDDQTPG